jgi:kynurenine formamidase
LTLRETRFGKQELPSAEDIDEFLRSRSNWGRWGDDDQIGTLNLITPEKRMAAAQLVRTGRTISLSRPVPTVPAANNPRPAEHFMYVYRRPNTKRASIGYDFIGIQCHGHTCTHLDALSHIWGENGGWNGRDPKEFMTFDGAMWGGIEHWREGIVTRGVLLDVARHRGVPYVTTDQPVHGWELQEIAEAQGVTVEPGDAVVIRSGHEAFERENPPYGSQPKKPGLHASCLWFLRETDCSALVWDMVEEAPFGYDVPFTIHGAIASFGLALIDNADLRSLAEACHEEGRYEFMLLVSPLLVIGATGSPVNPLAIF